MKIKIEIEEDGKLIEKTFSAVRMRGRALKRMLEIQDVMKSAEETGLFTQEHYDLMCEFICEIYNNDFTLDELLDGLDLEDIYPTFTKITEEIGNKTMKKMDNLLKK